MKKLVMIQLMMMILVQRCSKGCLKCTPDDKCQTCDSSKNYYLNEASDCQISGRVNCKSLNLSGECIECFSGFFKDQNTGNCIELPTQYKISKCSSYSKTFACIFCEPKFYISNGICLAVTSEVLNCEIYKANGVCLYCKKNFIFDINLKTCLDFPKTQNCMSYSYSVCSSCNSDYIFDKNTHISSIIASGNFDTIFNFNNLEFGFSPTNLSVCRIKNIPNCESYVKFDECQKCLPGFYLSERICRANSITPISNCKIYLSRESCFSCSTGFYSLYFECVPVTPIKNCKSYQTEYSTTTLCLECDAEHYLQNNICKLRTNNKTKNCLKYSLTEDECDSCINGYVLDSGKTSCISLTPNCDTYKIIGNETLATNCSTCKNGYYVKEVNSTKECIAGSLANCLVYETETECKECSNGYYLNQTKCLKHIDINFCSEYDKTSANKCSECQTSSILFTVHQICTPILKENLVSNCEKYNPEGTKCVFCQVSFFFNTLTDKCEKIPDSAANCLHYTKDGCSQCKNGYLRNKKAIPFSCFAYFDYATAYCFELADNLADNDSPIEICNTCAFNMIGFQTKNDEAICVKKSEFLFSTGYSQSVFSHCLRFGTSVQDDVSKVVCMECVDTHYLKIEDDQTTSCIPISSCPLAPGLSVLILDDLKGNVNICKFTSQNCQIYVRVSEDSFIHDLRDFACIKLRSQKLVFDLKMPEISNLPFFDFEVYSHPLSVKLKTQEYIHGFHFGDRKRIPSVFNFRGYGVSVPLEESDQVWQNCDIKWVFDSKGSFYNQNGPFTGVSAVPTSPLFSSCIKCSLGYHEAYSTQDGPQGKILVIPSCVKMTNCDSSLTVYGGLPTYLNAVVSCFKCSDNKSVSTFPTVLMEIDMVSATDSRGVFMNPLLKEVSDTRMFACAPKPASNFQTSTDSSAPKTEFANCGVIGILSVQKGQNTKLTENVNFCLACSTRFYPIYIRSDPNSQILTSSAPSYGLSSCEPISNCDATDTLKPFNSCGKCITVNAGLPNAIHYAFNDFRFNGCYPSNTPNCFILGTRRIEIPVTLDPNNPNVCSVCFAGFVLNPDGYCDSYRVPNSDQIESKFSGSFYNRKSLNSSFGNLATSSENKYWIRVHYALAFHGLGYGVSKCKDDYVKSSALESFNNLCVESNYMSSGAPRGDDSNFIGNCLNYNINPSVLICDRCDDKYTPEISVGTKNKCFPEIANCKFAHRFLKSICAFCKAGFLNIKGKCVANIGLSNCKILANNQATFEKELECSECLDGFYLTNVYTCLPGLVLGCSKYEPNYPYFCIDCLRGYTLVQLEESISYCYQHGQEMNCKFLESQTSSLLGFYQSHLSCYECIYTPDNPLKVTLFDEEDQLSPKTVCWPITKIENCISYFDSAYGNSEYFFLCQKCSYEYFVSSTRIQCLKRTNISTFCTTYEDLFDRCKVCKEGYLLDKTNFMCEENPNGIENCEVYSNSSSCFECKIGYFLLSGNCVLSTVIDNCLKYSSNNVCEKCQKDFYLRNKTSCVKAIANNCLNYSNQKGCSTCPKGFILSTHDGVTECVPYSIPNCRELDSKFVFKCRYCNEGYFIDSLDQCLTVLTFISNCDIYASSTTCLRCKKGYSLTPSGDLCTNVYSKFTDENCVDSLITTNPICSNCNFGYSFVNDQCSPCELFSSGCLICDTSSLKKCLLCQSNYYMDKNGNCIQETANKVESQTLILSNRISLIRISVVYSTVLFFVLWSINEN